MGFECEIPEPYSTAIGVLDFLRFRLFFCPIISYGMQLSDYGNKLGKTLRVIRRPTRWKSKHNWNLYAHTFLVCQGGSIKCYWYRNSYTTFLLYIFHEKSINIHEVAAHEIKKKLSTQNTTEWVAHTANRNVEKHFFPRE